MAHGTFVSIATIKRLAFARILDLSLIHILTMAMTALGAETSVDKFKKAGPKPFLLAAILFVWLIGGGYCLAKYVVPMMMNI